VPLVAELDTAHEELRVAEEEIRVQQAELERMQQHETTAQRVHEQFLSLLPAAVLVTDRFGNVRFANAAAAVMLGVRLDRLIGKPVFAYVQSDDRGDLRRLLTAVGTGEEEKARRVVQVRGRTSEPLSVEVALTSTAQRHGEGREVTWVLLGQDGAYAASVASTLLQITQLPVVTTDPAEILRRVAPLCQQAFTVPVGASLTVGAPVAPDQVATDSQLAQAADGTQFRAGEGPCQDAYEHGEVVVSNDAAVDPRWPRCHEGFRSLGVREVVAVPLEVADAVGGCLNVYSREPGLVTDAHLASADLLAGAVAAVLHESEMMRELAAVAEQMREAMASRATIEQAKGMLMARYGYDADGAFAELVRLSSSSNTKLRVVAAALVDHSVRKAGGL
jgi:PAS domain S-box-containing protein